MTYTYTGTVPPFPAANATQLQWDTYWNAQRQLAAAADIAERAAYRQALEKSTGAAVAANESRDALRDATAANTAMLKGVIDGMLEALKPVPPAPAPPAPAPAPRQPATRAELAALFLANMPEHTSFSDLQMVDAALRRADALLSRLAPKV